MITRQKTPCEEYCGREKACGNRYCSANPRHYEVVKDRKKKK